MVTFSPPVAPAVGSAPTVEVKTLKADFGDGYTQEGPDGLNHIRQSWSLIWPALTRAEADAIVTFFVARGGVEVFDYQVPGEATSMQFRCPAWMPPRDLGGVWTLTATFRQAFDIG